MLKLISTIFISLIIVILGLVACTTSSPAPSVSSTAVPTPSVSPTLTSAPSPKPTLAPSTQPAQTIQLKFAVDIPELGSTSSGWIWYMNEIEKRTGGKVKFDRYWGGSLVKQADQIDALLAGVVDITNTNAISRRQLLPVTHAFCLPTTGLPDTKEGHKAQREMVLSLVKKYPALSNEYKDFKLLSWNTDPARIMVSTKPVRTPADLKGVKVAAEGLGQDIVKAAGGTPVFIIPPETYLSMEKRVMDATIAVGWNHVQVYKLFEIAKYYLDYDFGQGATCLYMNNKSWNSLPPDVQKLMTDLLPELMATSDVSMLGAADKGKQSVLDVKGTIYKPTPDEMALWETVKSPTEEQWLSEMKTKGITEAPEILKEIKQIRDKALGK